MMKKRYNLKPTGTVELILLSFAFLKVMEMNACAYIDPGTGSVVLQLLAGLLFAGLLTIKRWSKFIIVFFSKNKPKDHDDCENKLKDHDDCN